VDATEDLSVRFNAVADYSAMAVRALGRQRVDSALEAIEGVMFPANDDFKRLVIFIFTNFTCSHTQNLSRAGASSAVFFLCSNCWDLSEVEIGWESDNLPRRRLWKYQND